MKTLAYLSLLLAIALFGCGGSADPVSEGSGIPTGGGGRVADYAGSYAGTVETVPADGTASRSLGTVTLAVAADGTVTGSRRLASTGADVPLTGTIGAQGRLSLTRSGTNGHGQGNISGYLAKQAGTAVATLVEDQDGNEAQTWYGYRLTGGTTTAVPAPLTTGLWLGANVAGATRFGGYWYSGDPSVRGTVSLVVSPSGTVSGTWKDASGASRKASGVLYDPAGLTYLQGLSGTLTVGGRTLELRFVPPSDGLSIGLSEVVGTASTPDGTVSDTLILNTQGA